MINILELSINVTNEDIALQAIKSIKNIIDSWVIYTQPGLNYTRLAEELKDIPGQFHSIGEEHKSACKYTITMFENQILHNAPELRRIVEKENSDCYELAVKDDKYLYYITSIYRNNHDCKDSIVLNYFHTHIYFFSFIDYYEQLLLIKTPKENVFLTAQKYHAIKNYEKAIESYERALTLDIDNEEKYECHYSLGCINHNIESLLSAYELDKRAEPLLQIAMIYYNNREYDSALKYVKQASEYEIPKNRLLLVDLQAYNEEIGILYANVLHKINKVKEANIIVKKFLEKSPHSMRLKRIDSYLDGKLKVLRKSSKPVIVYSKTNQAITYDNVVEYFFNNDEKCQDFLNRHYVDILIGTNLQRFDCSSVRKLAVISPDFDVQKEHRRFFCSTVTDLDAVLYVFSQFRKKHEDSKLYLLLDINTIPKNLLPFIRIKNSIYLINGDVKEEIAKSTVWLGVGDPTIDDIVVAYKYRTIVARITGTLSDGINITSKDAKGLVERILLIFNRPVLQDAILEKGVKCYNQQFTLEYTHA
jgi:tetratricopeptide (TPR) repeat protein